MKKQNQNQIMLSQSSARFGTTRTLAEIEETGNRHERRAAKAIARRAENSGKQKVLYSAGLSGSAHKK